MDLSEHPALVISIITLGFLPCFNNKLPFLVLAVMGAWIGVELASVVLLLTVICYYAKALRGSTIVKKSRLGKDFKIKALQNVWELDHTLAVKANWGKVAATYKQLLNALSDREFKNVRMYGSTEGHRDVNAPSRGSKKLSSALEYMKLHGITPKGVFADLCAGAGGFSSFMVEKFGMTGMALSFWKEKHESWMGPPGVRLVKGDFRNTEAEKGFDWILFDGGESNKNYDKEAQSFTKLLSPITNWIAANPKCNFVIKILTPAHPGVQQILQSIQFITGKGELIRVCESRMSNAEMYFVSTPQRDLKSQVYHMYTTLIHIIENPEAKKEPESKGGYEYKGPPVWGEPDDYGVPLLAPYNMESSIHECVKYFLRPARHITKFLYEIGYFKSSERGSSATFKNLFVENLTKLLRIKMPGIDAWKTTSTTAKSIFRVVGNKIDVEPVEKHKHWKRLKIGYKVMAKYLLRNGAKMNRLTAEEVIAVLNPKGSMGMQEDTITLENGKSLRFNNIKEYAMHKEPGENRFLWQRRVKSCKKSMLDGKPILGIFNTVAKTEKKCDVSRSKDKASRLVWFLPATMRIFECQVFGMLEQCVEKLPYSVSGIPLYDYGESLAKIFFPTKRGRVLERKAICNDIAGWDTKISYGLQCLEAWFLKQLTKDEELKQDMELLYRLYANSHVMIARDSPDGEETAIYKLRGQVASGRRTTYGMNTITNIVVSMAAAAYSQGISDDHFEKWMTNNLNKGHTPQFGGKISGDDSALIFGKRESEQFAEKAHIFLNEIGLIRKDMYINEKSLIIDTFEDIDFCSNHYTNVEYGKGNKRVKRWMPVRPLEEIMGKACIMLAKPKDYGTHEAWARIQGLQLITHYHHIPEVKALALSLLSCTDDRINLQSISLGWRPAAQPWIAEGDVLDIITKCLFGASTTISELRDKIHITEWNQLAMINYAMREKFSYMKTSVRKRWYNELPQIILSLRKPGVQYTDWNDKMRPISFSQ